MSNIKQNSVGWLFSEMYKIISFYAGNEQDVLCESIKQQAKEMRRQEHEKTWNNAINAVEKDKWDSFEQYYNETYGDTNSN